MKNYLKYLFIFLLFIISLIYTNNSINIAKDIDPIMKKIKIKKDNFQIESVNAIIKDNTIIPGMNGCVVDINKSYENMKRINSYNDNLIKYKDIIPEISLYNIYDKYIEKGSNKERSVSIVLYIKDKNIINNIANIKLNVFLDANILKNGKIDINNSIKVYNGGNNMNYDDTTIEWINDVISDNYNSSNYCININKDDSNLLSCARNKMHTISPSNIYTNIYDLKNDITNGSIIYFSEHNLNNISIFCNYLLKKGYNIVYLDELLSEKGCK